MDMQMVDRLAPVGTGVDYQPISACSDSQLLSNPAGGRE